MLRILSFTSICITFVVMSAGTAFAVPSPTRSPAQVASIQPGTIVHAASCEQAPPQSARDRTSYTTDELLRYGLPLRQPGESMDVWTRVVRSAGKRVCDRQATNLNSHLLGTSDQHDTNWGGNIADEPNGSDPDTYREIDSEFYVPNITQGTSESYALFWVGLGGFDNQNNNLVQTGVEAHRLYVANNGWFTIYDAFVENTAYTQNPGVDTVFPVNPTDFIFAQTYTNNCNFVQDMTTSTYTTQCYGPTANQHSAEAVAERPSFCDANGNNCTPTTFANFGSVTLLGVGINDNGTYKSIHDVNHDYSNIWSSTSGGYQLASVGPIFYDGSQNPPYDYKVTWLRYS